MNIMIGEFVELKKGGRSNIFIERIFDEILDREKNDGESETENGEFGDVPDGDREKERYVRHGGDVERKKSRHVRRKYGDFSRNG